MINNSDQPELPGVPPRPPRYTQPDLPGMPKPEVPEGIAGLIRAAMDEARGNGSTIKDIAVTAKVDYNNLLNWYTTKVTKLDVTVAEKVWQALTGNRFTQ